MKKYLIILFFLFAATACRKTEFEPAGPTDIRILNISDQNLTDVKVNIKSMTNTYGSIGAGMTSEYMRFDTAYVKAEITAKVNSETFSTGTVNYMGLTYLGQVKVTYEIWIKNFNAKVLEISDVIYEEALVLK